jgi:phosphoglucosamine mutase
MSLNKDDEAMKDKRLFGTDGIRGEANIYPMTVDVALRLGQALAYFIRDGHLGLPIRKDRPKILIAKDTRLSGYCFEQALTAGICSMGVDVCLAGPIPTPVVSFLTKELGADLGVMISASHNPFIDNGFKIFNFDGFKLPDSTELKIERLVLDAPQILIDCMAAGAAIGRAHRAEQEVPKYFEFVRNKLGAEKPLEGLRVVLDSAHGAAYKLAPQIFTALGASVISIASQPDGTNINEGVGSMHPAKAAKAVVEHGAHVGFAFDGDADRVVLIDEQGEILSGDAVIALLTKSLLFEGQLRSKRIVATVMSNAGLEHCLSELGVEVIREQVGDRYVLERLKAEGLSFGGEESGHLILLDCNTTGDGILSALFLAKMLKNSGQPLSELKQFFKPAPRVVINVPVKEKVPFSDIPGLTCLLEETERRLEGLGRMLVRYSGTEKKARILIEGLPEPEGRYFADRIAACLR